MQRPRREGSDSAPRTRSHSRVNPVDVIVLTADTALLATLQEAAGVGHQFQHAFSIEASVELLLRGQCGIFIIDAALVGNELARLTEKLQAQFPEVVLLATGQRSDQNAIASLVTSGRIYRFLHKPVSPARAELFLSAATRRYSELHHADSRGPVAPLQLTNPRARNALVGVVLSLVVAGIAWALWPRSEPAQPTAAVEPAAPPQPDAAPLAQIAAEQAERDRRAADAELAATKAIATKTAATARAARVTPPPAPAPTPRQTARAQSPRATPHLDVAKTFLAANQLIEPIEANALDQLRQARAGGEDPGAVHIAATDLGTRLVNRALAAATAGNLQEAKRAHQSASDLDREFETSLPDVDAAGDRIRELELASQRTTLANEQLARATRLRTSGRLIDPPGNNAYEALKQILTDGTTTNEVRNEQQRLSFALLENTRTALAAGNVDAADVLATRAEEILPGLTQTKTLREQIGAARGERDNRTAVVQAATLKRKREVSAVYPRDALMNKTEGWVDLEFTIDTNGVPTDIAVKSSRPQRVFDAAALYALRQWRFEPIVRDGTAQSRRATLRMEFKLK